MSIQIHLYIQYVGHSIKVSLETRVSSFCFSLPGVVSLSLLSHILYIRGCVTDKTAQLLDQISVNKPEE